MKVEIDVAVEPGDRDALVADVQRKHRVTMRMIQEHGSGGGWPVFHVEGERPDVAAALAEMGYDDDLSIYELT